MLRIRTAQTATKAGAGRIVAKGGGKQVTLPYDHSKSSGDNHGLAAAELALKVQPTGWTVEQVGSARKEKMDKGWLITIG